VGLTNQAWQSPAKAWILAALATILLGMVQSTSPLNSNRFWGHSGGLWRIKRVLLMVVGWPAALLALYNKAAALSGNQRPGQP
jgi:hypothetical protein